MWRDQEERREAVIGSTTMPSFWSTKKMAFRTCRLAAATVVASSSSSSRPIVAVAFAPPPSIITSSSSRSSHASLFVVGRSIGASCCIRSSWTKSTSFEDGGDGPTSSRLKMSSTEASSPTDIDVTPSSSLTSVNSSSSSASPWRVKTAAASLSAEIVSIKGWVRTVRKQKTLAFVEVNDGSSMGGIQCVLPFNAVDESTMMGECVSFVLFGHLHIVDQYDEIKLAFVEVV